MTLVPDAGHDEVDYRQAAETLRVWLAGKRYTARVDGWTRWTYGDKPFWSAWVEVIDAGWNHFTIGVHVYDDGEVAVVTTNEGGMNNED